MKKNIIRLLLIQLLLLSVSWRTINAQDFTYHLKDTVKSYQSIVDSTATFLPLNSDFVEIVPSDFSFAFAGMTVDTIKWRFNGVFSFDPLSKYCFSTFFKSFLISSDTLFKTQIAYKKQTIQGELPALIVEFVNLKVENGNEVSYLNFQVKFIQFSNSIEFHFGGYSGASINDSCMIGLINMFDPSVSGLGFLLQGSPSAPEGISIGVSGAAVQLSGIPSNGQVYKFTKDSN